MTVTHNLNRHVYGYMDLRVGPYERRVEGNISEKEYPIRDVLVSDQEWGGHQRCQKCGTKVEYAQDTPFSRMFFWSARHYRSITRVSAQFWGCFSYSCLLVAGCVLGEDWGWCPIDISQEGKGDAGDSCGNTPQPRHLEIEFEDETRKRKGTGAVSSAKVKGRVLCVEWDTVLRCPRQF